MATNETNKLIIGSTTYNLKDDSGTASSHIHTKSQITDLGTIGTAAAKNSTNAVTSGSTDLVESGAVYEAIQQGGGGGLDPTILAPEFNTSIAYGVGDYVIYENKLYRFKSAHPAGAWDSSHADEIKAVGQYVTAGKKSGTTLGKNATAEGDSSTASGNYSHAEGAMARATGTSSHAEGSNTTASVKASHAEGTSTNATGTSSHAEGYNTTASGDHSHAEGYNTTASGDQSHAEGSNTTASGSRSHAEGMYTTASGNHSHAEGYNTTASGDHSHAEGYNTTASGSRSHAGGVGTIAQRKSQTVIGEYNTADTGGSYETVRGTYVLIIGNGTSNDARSNALTVDWDGNVAIAGTYSNSGSDYAEKFEAVEDCPVCRFVTLDGEKIRLAQDNDYILGVTSENPSILADDKNNGIPVGLLGKLWVEHDGSAEVNSYVISGKNGIAIKSDKGYRVMAVNGNKCKILVK